MKIYSTRIVEGLRERGFDVIEAKDVCRGDPDKAALSLSAAAGRIMITDDWGFGELAIRLRQPAIGVIIYWSLCSSRPQAGGFRRRTYSGIGRYLFWAHHNSLSRGARAQASTLLTRAKSNAGAGRKGLRCAAFPDILRGCCTSTISHTASRGGLLFEQATAAIPDGHKVGLVGRNGTGKTTLLRLIAGEFTPDDGSINFPKNATIAHVSQEAPGGPRACLKR